MAHINILPKEVYQLIAAGEVVERPLSVVKEMIENSVDAGATSITVEIRNGGSTYIRITDNGCGIERAEIKKVFMPHATSKISLATDLDAISTLGFRGEAMASISAVSRVEVLSRAKGEDIGTRYEVAGGEEISLDDAGCPDGTTIVVRDIFYNTPARMKFLKKDVTEGNAVAGIVDRMAISHPEVSFRFIRDGKQTLITSGNGDLKSTIYSVFGRDVSDSMIDIDYTYENMRVSGFVSKPVSSRKSRAMQFFFINHRLIKSQTAMAALEQAYKNSIMVGSFPMCVLNIELNPALVDVNVHPAKIEVRFANEKPVFDLIYYGVKTAIEQDRSVKEAHLSPTLEQLYAPVDKGDKTYSSRLDFFKKKDEPPVQQTFRITPRENFYKSGTVVSAPEPVIRDNTAEKKALENIQPSDNTQSASQEQIICDENDKSNVTFRLIGEAFGTYLIVELENELYFIDKHAAHERMNYERLKSQATVESQLLLSPVAVNLAKDEYSAILDNIDLLEQCGFRAEPFGDSAIIVREIPSLVDDCQVSDLMCEIASKLLEHKTDITPEKIDWIYHSASCRGAVKAGDKTTPKEQELFVERLLSMPQIRFCPHGRPVFIRISRYDIEKQFGRA